MKQVIKVLLVIVLTFFALHGLTVVSEYVGYASHSGEAGNIYQLVLRHAFATDHWAGIFGVAVRVPGFTFQQSEGLSASEIESENLLFDCLSPDNENEVYASTFSDFDLSSVTPATPAEVDTFFGLNGSAVDGATSTLVANITFDLGTLSITAPGTYTYTLDEGSNSVVFPTAAIKDALGRVGFAIVLSQNFTIGFNGANAINFQALLPVFQNTSETTYYFYADPNNDCPAGDGDAPATCTVIGNVTDQSGTPLEDAIVEVAAAAALSDVNGAYNISTAPITGTRIFGIKEGYKLYYNNFSCTANETVYHNIVLIEDVTDTNTGVGPGEDDPGTDVGPGEDVGPGQSDKTDEGPGEIPPVPFVEEPKQIEGKDYIISLSEIRRKIRIDNFHQESLYFFSFKKVPGAVKLELHGENLSNIMTFDKTEFDVPPNGNEEVIITIWGRPPVGVYKGNVTIDGDFNATIPVHIEILPAEKLPVEALLMNLETNKKNVLPGKEFKFKTDLRNLLIDQQYPVKILFTIQPVGSDEIIWTFDTNVYLKTAFSLIRSVELPKEIASGDYVLRASANYLGFGSATSTIFHVDVPFWSKTFLGLKNWIWAIILATLAAGAIAGFLIYRNIQSKKKFHLTVEYSEMPKPGPRNIFVGKIAETENKTYMNLENFKVHTIVAGSTGGGKSVSAQVIVEEALDRGVSVICFDPTAQWTGMLRPCKDKMMLSLYPFFGMKKNEAKAYNGNVRMITDPYELIDIKKYAKPGEIQVFAGHKLDPKDMDIVVANAIREIFHANFQESKPLKILFVFDEVHRLLPKFGGSGDGFLQIERGCREFRKWGLGIVLVSQVLSDFMGTIKANINTEIQMRTRDDGDLERVRQKYGEGVLRSLVKATVGSGMVENPAYNRGKPYFVAFRPLKHSVERMPDEEIEEYNEYNDKVDEQEFSLQQLEDEGIDVFDLKLELKLALDKVKQGNFNMVKIYLEGLVPRIDKQWEKLGKKPKEFVRKTVDKATLEADLKKAQEEKETYDAEHKEEEKSDEKKEWEWADDAPPDKLLSLKNGMVILSLASMYDEVSAMKDEDYESEINDGGKNNLADWVENATGLKNIANNMRVKSGKDDVLALLKKFKEGEEIPDVEVPKEAPAPAKEGETPKEESDEKGSAEKPTEQKEEPAAPDDAKETPAAPKPQDEAPKTEKPPEDAAKVDTPAKPVEKPAEQHEEPQETNEQATEGKPPEGQTAAN
ncbi:MAG: DUF853 family protein [Candidatus Woesearchaeota archaeon]|nr:DUF853 family protein [Candidatus Woesearchaeota archaeon]